MAQHVAIHPVDPQRRLVLQVVEQLNAGAVIAYPTDSSYALGCPVAYTHLILPSIYS